MPIIMSKIDRICDLLDKEYEEHVWVPHAPPLDELILTILSQNTTGSNCKRAFDRLKSRFPDWQQVMDAPGEEIAEAIRPAGLARTRAVRIKQIIREIYEKQENLDLTWLSQADSNEVMRYLLSFKGVGPKTAACVLLFSLGRPVLPVDTHVYRVSIRLGLIPETISVEASQEVLGKMVPEQRVYSFHINMISHGRTVCKAGRPLCGICVLKEDCDYFAQQTGTD
jgi:endonuclease-3